MLIDLYMFSCKDGVCLDQIDEVNNPPLCLMSLSCQLCCLIFYPRNQIKL